MLFSGLFPCVPVSTTDWCAERQCLFRVQWSTCRDFRELCSLQLGHGWESNPTVEGVSCHSPVECARTCCMRPCAAFQCPHPLETRPDSTTTTAPCTTPEDCQRKCCQQVRQRIVPSAAEALSRSCAAVALHCGCCHRHGEGANYERKRRIRTDCAAEAGAP